MTHTTFSIVQDRILARVKEIGTTKGIEYAHSGNRLANFIRLGEELEIDPCVVCWIYTKKHLDGIVSYIKEAREFSEEGIEGRIVDAITYLTLLQALFVERRHAIVDKGEEALVCPERGEFEGLPLGGDAFDGR